MTLTLEEGWYPVAVFISYILAIVLFGGRVLIRKKPIGVTLSWILLIVILPVIGVVLYLLFGESYVGFYRARRAKFAFQRFVESVSTNQQHPLVISQQVNDPASPLWDQTFGAMKLPAVRGNSVGLLPDADRALAQLLTDIQNASNSIHMEFYICQLGGRIDGIFDALADAVSRGVDVRVMCDSVGSRQLLKSTALDALRQKGIRVEEALHANLLRVLIRRQDLRMHRKIIVIDRWISYTGSMNLVDPVFSIKTQVSDNGLT